MRHTLSLKSRAGKITLYSIVSGSVAIGAMTYLLFFQVGVSNVVADNVSTSVTVLNTPPQWTIDAEEAVESSATSPTNAGSVITWDATATDDNAENYYLIICKTSASPTANSSAAPSCGGGIGNQWAVSSLTSSGAEATAATTTIEYAPFDAEDNDWYAWICDGNASLPQCNATSKQGTGSTASPFVVNHPPVFSLISNDGPEDPGGTITWTSTSYDNDTSGGADTVQLFVCKSNDFTGTYCGAGGSWATSTLTASNAATSTTLGTPLPDATYSGYVYVVDSHGLVATSSYQAFNSSFDVNNVAPTVTAATISLVDTDDVGNLTLLVPNATSGPFKVQFTAVDNNSCQTSVAGDEFSLATTSVYRSGITQVSCNESSEYNSNSCYPSTSPYMTGFSCTQDVGSCTDSDDSDATWTCTFNFWYNADPTDASTQYTAENWLASVQVVDDDSALSPFTEASSGNELVSFLAFDVSSSSIPYGGLQPGSNSTNLGTSTDLVAYGNVGLDETLYGDTMCTTWSTADSCDTDGIDPTRDIPVGNQQFATSTVAYSGIGAYTLTSSTSPATLLVNVPKTTSTSSPQTGYTFWGIGIPGAITLAGDYSGQNTLTAIKSDPSNW